MPFYDSHVWQPPGRRIIQPRGLCRQRCYRKRVAINCVQMSPSKPPGNGVVGWGGGGVGGGEGAAVFQRQTSCLSAGSTQVLLSIVTSCLSLRGKRAEATCWLLPLLDVQPLVLLFSCLINLQPTSDVGLVTEQEFLSSWILTSRQTHGITSGQ